MSTGRILVGSHDGVHVLKLTGDVRVTLGATVDGERIEFEVRADAIVQRKRRRYVAEIKTGRAASVRSRHTRRQLLEYALLYDADGVLLVDATGGTIHEVEFSALSRRRGRHAPARRS